MCTSQCFQERAHRRYMQVFMQASNIITCIAGLYIYIYHDPQPEITLGFTNRSLIIENSPGVGVPSINSRFKRMRVSKCKSQWSTEVKSDGQGCLGSVPTR